VKGESKVSSEKFKSCHPDQAELRAIRKFVAAKISPTARTKLFSATVGMK